MDIRNEIIERVMERLGEADERVQDALTVVLNDYEVTARCTEVAVNDSGDLLKKFIATKRIEGLSENTIKRYYNINSELLDFLHKPLEDITTFDLRFFLSLRRDRDGISNRTLDGMRRCYNSFFGWLHDEGFIPANPCKALKQIKYKRDVKKPFTAVELEKIRKACNVRDLALVEFLYSTGCRVSEVARLDISDIDFENMECRVLGKGNKERVVYLSSVCTMHLLEYLRGRTDMDAALFVGKRGRLTKSGIGTILRTIGERAGVENVYPHRFRRTLATNLLDRGMNIQDVAAILGHSDLRTTQIYCYISQSNVRAAYVKFAA